MRHSLVASLVVLAACQHSAAARPMAAPTAAADSAGADRVALCTAQRAENRFRSRAARCAADEDCVHVGQYETGTCDGWVTRPDAEQVLRQMRAATDGACQDLAQVTVVPACPDAAGTCVEGRCTAHADRIGDATATVPAFPEDFRCIASGLQRVGAEKKLPAGRVELRFPLAIDGRPPRYFEAVAPVDPEAAVGVARAFGTCRWKVAEGGAIPPGVWGSMSMTLRE